jgi:hypothetical protein
VELEEPCAWDGRQAYIVRHVTPIWVKGMIYCWKSFQFQGNNVVENRFNFNAIMLSKIVSILKH